ncbi:MAG: C1 family peptidase [Desulfobacteraceae bacterium]|nr:C1 family peptidase [Desulfobacteraceae bacterium]
MNLARSVLCITAVLLALGTNAVDAFAYKRALGDRGKPADYDATIRHFPSARSGDAANSIQSAAASFNWKSLGMVTEARDQGSCGACWAFAVVGVFESKLLMAGAGTYDLSEQQQVSCNTEQSKCTGGDSSALHYWEWNGPMLESCTQYPSSDGVTVPECYNYDVCTTLDWRTTNYKSTDYYTVDTTNIAQMKAALETDGPAYFRFDVYSDFYTFWDSGVPGKVYTQKLGSSYEGGHAVLLIGWNDAKGAWLLRNNWGATGGPNGDGTFWMAYKGHGVDLGFGMANARIYSFQDCGYTERAVPYDFVDISGLPPDQVTELKLADDGVYGFDLPFPFIYYCLQYNGLFVDSNGLVQLSSADSVFRNAALPNTDHPGPFLAPFWSDLAPGTGTANGKVYAAVTGAAPERVLIVEWKDVPAHYYSPASPSGILSNGTITFEMKYFEATGAIEYHYLDTVFSADSSEPEYWMNNGASATVGIQRNGEEAVQHSCNKENAVTGGSAIQFVPPAGKTGILTVDIGPSEAAGAGATWSVDGGTAQAGGGSLIVLAGTHTISFTAVTGYNTPASMTVTVPAGGALTITGAYTKTTGSLTVTLSPGDAVSSGAQWRLDSGAWLDSGATLSDIKPGNHALSFKPLTGYISPASRTVAITEGQAATATGAYVLQAGSLRVILSPASAVTAGARWQVDGGDWLDSGTTVSGLKAGAHTVSFNSVFGYTTPATKTLNIANNKTTSLTTAYPMQTGAVKVVITPSSAVKAGARWSLDGGPWRSSGSTAKGVIIGEHTISFRDVAAHDTPASRTVTVSHGVATIESGAYVLQTGSLTVTLSPDDAVSSGALWRVDSGAWLSGGTTVSGLKVGTHTVSFKPTVGYTTPVTRKVTISKDLDTPDTGAYILQTGSLRVILSPAAAVTAGVKWQVDGGDWLDSGTTVPGLKVGKHTVSFISVFGYTTPATKTLNIANNKTTSMTAAYPMQTGAVKVVLTPSSAVKAGARWSIDGGAWRSSGSTAGIMIGEHTVSFRDVAGYTTPASRKVTVSRGIASTVTSAYIQ